MSKIDIIMHAGKHQHVTASSVNLHPRPFQDSRPVRVVLADPPESLEADPPSWAHYMMATAIQKCVRGCQDDGGTGDTCRSSSKCITEYCVRCYADVFLAQVK